MFSQARTLLTPASHRKIQFWILCVSWVPAFARRAYVCRNTFPAMPLHRTSMPRDSLTAIEVNHPLSRAGDDAGKDDMFEASESGGSDGEVSGDEADLETAQQKKLRLGAVAPRCTTKAFTNA